MGTSVALKDRVFGSHFSQIPHSLVVDASDRAVLLAALAGNLLGVFFLFSFLFCLIPLSKGRPAAARGQQLTAALQSLQAQLEQLLQYAKDRRQDAAVGRALQSALGSGKIKDKKKKKKKKKTHFFQASHARAMNEAAHEGALQDILSVSTLGQLTRAQIQACASLHALFTPPAAKE